MQIKVCANCGSERIESLAWIKLNDKSFVEWSDDSDVWCPDCNERVETEFKEQLIKVE